LSAPGNSAPAPSSYQEALADPSRCIQSGCRERALDGKDRCAPHYAAARAADQRYKRKRRGIARRKKLCMRCTRRKRLAGHKWGCARCVAEMGRLNRVGDTNVYKKRPKAEGFDARAEGDGYERRRYRGQGKRGRQPASQLDEQDIRDAKKHFERAIEALRYHHSDEGQGLPLFQRQEIRNASDAEFNRAFGFVEDIWRRHRYIRPTVDSEED
jgi:hypothetical protein